MQQEYVEIINKSKENKPLDVTKLVAHVLSGKARSALDLMRDDIAKNLLKNDDKDFGRENND